MRIVHFLSFPLAAHNGQCPDTLSRVATAHRFCKGGSLLRRGKRERSMLVDKYLVNTLSLIG
jgi:hypothetical protein